MGLNFYWIQLFDFDPLNEKSTPSLNPKLISEKKDFE